MHESMDGWMDGWIDMVNMHNFTVSFPLPKKNKQPVLSLFLCMGGLSCGRLLNPGSPPPSLPPQNLADFGAMVAVCIQSVAGAFQSREGRREKEDSFASLLGGARGGELP